MQLNAHNRWVDMVRAADQEASSHTGRIPQASMLSSDGILPAVVRRLASPTTENISETYKLVADFRGSPIVANGSRAPSFFAIHFFSLAMISNSSFLSSAVGITS